MKIEEINEMWEQDSHIDRNDLTKETLRTPMLHQKYLSLLMTCKGKLIKHQKELREMRMLKFRYYRGELSKEELEQHGLLQYQGLKPLKQDMDNMLEADDDVSVCMMRIQYLENMIYQLESIMHQIKGRDWTLRNHLEWLKFQAGN